MRSFLAELGVQPGVDLDAVLSRAWQVHELRKQQEKVVSRSSLLYAACTVNPLVMQVFEECGLRRAAWERSLNLPVPFQFMPSDAPDFEVDRKRTLDAIQEHATKFAERPLDSLGLAAALMAHIDGQAERHLRTAGVDLRRASARLDELVLLSPVAGSLDLSALDVILSNGANRIYSDAWSIMSSSEIAGDDVTSSFLVVAILRASKNTAAPAEFARLIASAGGNDVSEKIDDWIAWYPRSSNASSDRPLVTSPLAAILLTARTLAQRVTGARKIHSRHLVGAIIAAARNEHSDTGVQGLFRHLGINASDIAVGFLNWIERRAQQKPQWDRLAPWREFLGIKDEGYLPRFDAESLEGDDLLDVTSEVNAFATLIASTDIKPPLSIGLFGDWGSGKSCFMAKLREQIRDRAGRDSKSFYRKIVQIEFNAWHYVEANLWASLIDHIFKNLRLTTGETAEDERKRRDELIANLDATMKARTEAEEALRRAEIERDQVAKELDAKKKAAEATATRVKALPARDVWELVDLGDSAGELRKLLQETGAGRILESKDAIRRTVDDLRGFSNRLRLLGRWLATKPSKIWLLLLVVGAPLAVGALVHLVAKSSAFDTVARVATLIASVTAWLGKQLKSGNAYLQEVDEVREEIDKKIQDAEDDRKKVFDAAEAELTTATSAVDQAKEALAVKDGAVTAAKHDLAAISAGEKLARFIDERAASDDYRKLLGVLATARNDFFTLSQLMYPPPGMASPLGEDSRVDRIILYIDDLDRCHPDRVVEVLQAVHLLLAFKLFVVVVGVDARWINESLKQRYGALSKGKGVAGYGVKPHDYLEKIFQVPFWLQPMDAANTATYVRGLLGTDVVEKTGQQKARLQIASGGGGATGSVAVTAAGTQSDAARAGAPEPEPDPEQLQIRDTEAQFMMSDVVTALVGRSPRTAKRYVNTYRFLRAAIPARQIEAFVADAGIAEYKGVLLLLAIVVGAPNVSLELVRDLRAAANVSQSLTDFAKGILTRYAISEYHDEWMRVAAALRDFESDRQPKVSDLTPHISRTIRYSFRSPYAPLPAQKQTAADRSAAASRQPNV